MEISLELEGITGFVQLALLIIVPFIVGLIVGRKLK
jgi:hypothetical protein